MCEAKETKFILNQPNMLKILNKITNKHFCYRANPMNFNVEAENYSAFGDNYLKLKGSDQTGECPSNSTAAPLPELNISYMLIYKWYKYEKTLVLT